MLYNCYGLEFLNTTSIVGFGHECKYALQLLRVEFLNTTSIVGFGHECKLYALQLLRVEFLEHYQSWGSVTM